MLSAVTMVGLNISVLVSPILLKLVKLLGVYIVACKMCVCIKARFSLCFFDKISSFLLQILNGVSSVELKWRSLR